MLCIELLRVKCSKLCANKVVKGNIYSAATVSIFNASKSGSHGLLELTPYQNSHSFLLHLKDR